MTLRVIKILLFLVCIGRVRASQHSGTLEITKVISMRAYLSIFSIPTIACLKASFTESFVKQNNGKSQIEALEVQELVCIAIALIQTGIADSYTVDHTTGYY